MKRAENATTKVPYEVYIYPYKTGIKSSKAFEEKRLANYGVDVGVKCGHDCKYCSTPSLNRCHESFRAFNLNAYHPGYAIFDPDTPNRIRQQAKRIRKRGLAQLCTTTDAWAPEAQPYRLGRRCLEAILGEQDWRVRILTKNAAVLRDFDVIQKYRDRVLLGLSTTSIPSLEIISSVVEPHASPVSRRYDVIEAAHRAGISTYGMFCPILPGALSDVRNLERMFESILRSKPVEIFAEPVNARGPGLKNTAQALRNAGLEKEAQAVDAIRRRSVWRKYAVRLVETLLDIAQRKYTTSKMRILLYSSGFDKDTRDMIGRPEGVIWLGKHEGADTAEMREKQGI